MDLCISLRPMPPYLKDLYQIIMIRMCCLSKCCTQIVESSLADDDVVAVQFNQVSMQYHALTLLSFHSFKLMY